VVAAGLAAAAAEFGGQVVPGHAGLEHEQNAGQDLTRLKRLAARGAEAARGRGRQQRLNALPKRGRYECPPCSSSSVIWRSLSESPRCNRRANSLIFSERSKAAETRLLRVRRSTATCRPTRPWLCEPSSRRSSSPRGTSNPCRARTRSGTYAAA